MRNVYLCCIIGLSICALGMQGTVNTQQNTVVVPNVKGVSLEVAAKILQTVGLQPWFHGSSNLAALVERQVPQPGFELPIGGEVILVADTTGKTTLNVLSTGTQQFTSSVSLQPEIPTTGVSIPRGTSAVTSSNVVTYISVAPDQTTWQTSQSLAYPVKQQGDSSTIFYQPSQRAISRYFVADPQPRFYPAWYPKQFLTVVSPQGSTSTQPLDSMRITVQPQVVGQTGIQSYLTWYPKVYVSGESSWESGILSQSDREQRIGVFAVSTTPAVPVPNLLWLRQGDATVAIQKAGLTVGKISRVQSSQARPGLVLQQTPRARAIVQAGTQVHLWVAE